MGKTVQAHGVIDRVTTGNDILAASTEADTKLIREPFQLFVKVHRAYAGAHKGVAAAEQAIGKLHEVIGTLDVDQDALVDEVANVLSSDVGSRRNPFAVFKFPSPSDVKKMGDVAEAKLIVKFVAAVRKRKGLSPRTLKALAALEKVSNQVIKAAVPMEKLVVSLSDATSKRHSLAQPWSNSLAALKRATRSAEDRGAKGLYAALFVRDEPAKKKKPAAKTAPVADAAPK